MEASDYPANWDHSHYNGHLTIVDLAIRCTDEAETWRLLEEMRWGDRDDNDIPTNVACPHCGCTDVHYIEPSNGSTRLSASGTMSARRVWKCHKRGGGCGRQFTVTVGTVMHRTKLPIRYWLFVMFEMMASKNGVAAREIQRKYKISSKAAWHMLHRIREAMTTPTNAPPMEGTVRVDETRVGGKATSMNRKTRANLGLKEGNRQPNMENKTIVLTIMGDKGEARSRVINDVTSTTLDKHLSNTVAKDRTHLQTDELTAYKRVGKEMASHQAVDHSKGEYGRGTITTNPVESFFSQLKRSIDGTHHHISSVHLQRYLNEFDYRHSTRHLNDTQRLLSMVSGHQFARPLPYSQMIGKA